MEQLAGQTGSHGDSAISEIGLYWRVRNQNNSYPRDTRTILSFFLAIHDLPCCKENPWHKCQRQWSYRNFVVSAVDEWHLAVLNGHDQFEHD